MSSIILGRIHSSWSAHPAFSTARLVRQSASSVLWAGAGYLAGEPPADLDPESPDGRTRIDGAVASCRVQVLSRIGMVVVAETRSAPDGTWRVDGLDPAVEYVVIGLDDAGTTNAAIADRIRPAVD